MLARVDKRGDGVVYRGEKGQDEGCSSGVMLKGGSGGKGHIPTY